MKDLYTHINDERKTYRNNCRKRSPEVTRNKKRTLSVNHKRIKWQIRSLSRDKLARCSEVVAAASPGPRRALSPKYGIYHGELGPIKSGYKPRRERP